MDKVIPIYPHPLPNIFVYGVEHIGFLVFLSYPVFPNI